jgi:hypothetical protein
MFEVGRWTLAEHQGTAPKVPRVSLPPKKRRLDRKNKAGGFGENNTR